MTQEPPDATPSIPVQASPRSPRGSRTICLPSDEQTYLQIVSEPTAFRAWLAHHHRQTPELFPSCFAQGYHLKDRRTSPKLGLPLRRIALLDGSTYTIRPSCLMPYLGARTSDVETGLLLRKFGVPLWAIARVCGRTPMFWYRQQGGLGRASLVGTTVRRAAVPAHLLADEHHQRRVGLKTYIATTGGAGCCLGAEPTDTADTPGLHAAYEVFRQEAQDVVPTYTPRTVNTDGWSGTQAAWKALFPKVVLTLCFLHAWLSIRDRGRHLGALFADLSTRVGAAYQAPTRRSFAQRLRHLRTWAQAHLVGIVRDKTLSLCNKRDRFAVAYRQPGCHRTSNMLDRMMRSMNRSFFDGQHLHGSLAMSRLHCRGWALLHRFAPWAPAITRANQGWRCPAERLNGHRYHEHWLDPRLTVDPLRFPM
jgi:hypothetical protein